MEIAVALVAMNNPIGAVPAAILFAALQQGGGVLEARLGVSSALVLVMQGCVIAVVAGSAFLTRRIRSRRVIAPATPPPSASRVDPVTREEAGA